MTSTRQQRRDDAFRREFAAMKEQYGHGLYSWTVGMTRRIARRIARIRAKKAARA